jgi:hypothetical protein
LKKIPPTLLRAEFWFGWLPIIDLKAKPKQNEASKTKVGKSIFFMVVKLILRGQLKCFKTNFQNLPSQLWLFFLKMVSMEIGGNFTQSSTDQK